jgi:hypothetical protein
MSEGWLTGFEPAISRSTIGPDQPAEQTPNPYAISTLALRVSFAKRRVPSHVFAGKRGIPEAKTVENGSVDKVEIVNVTSIDMSPDAPRLTSRGGVSYLRYSNHHVPLVPPELRTVSPELVPRIAYGVPGTEAKQRCVPPR